MALGPGYGEFRTDYEPILARIARTHFHSGASARAAIVDHGSPGAWHGTSASAPATTVACSTDAEVLEGVLGALDSHEFVFARLMGLADALGWVTPRSGTDGNPAVENPETPRGVVAPASSDNTNPSSPPSAATVAADDEPKNILYSAVTNLEALLTRLHAALPPRTAFLLLSGHSDPRAMSVLNARRAEYLANQNQNQSDPAAGISSANGTAGGAVRWSTADDRALEEAVGRARMGLMFVGVKT